MLTLRSRVGALALSVLVVLPLAGFSLTGEPECEKYDEASGECLVTVPAPAPSDPPPGDTTDPAPGDGGGGGAAEPCVNFLDEVKPCTDGDSWWSNELNCYISETMYDFPKGHPIWEGNTTGAIYDCYDPDIIGTRMGTFWSQNPPAGPAAPPDPRVLAQEALAKMNLRAPKIGIAPKDEAGSVGLVGLPVWMWVADAGARTWGPNTTSASAGGHTVTATGTVDKVVWTMGDGNKVTCTAKGTPFTPDLGVRKSPDCGHTYSTMGEYTVTATAHWTVAWSGMGQSGEIPMTLDRSTTIRIGEAQAVKTG